MIPFRPSRADNSLSTYWNALVRNAPAEELARLAAQVEPSALAAIHRAYDAHRAYQPDPAFAHRLEQILMDTSISPIAGTIPQPRVSPPFTNGRRDTGRTRPAPLAPASHRSRRFAPALSIGLVILVVLASLGGIWLFNERRDDPRVLAPPVATPSAEASPDVPMFRGNPARTGEMPGPGVNGSPVELWNVSIPGEITTQSAIVDGVMYVGSSSGGVYALEIASGNELWSFTASSAINSSPAVSNGLVYVGSEDGTLYALATDDGRQVWTESGARQGSAVAIVDSTIYMGGDDGLYALDAATGATIWKAPLTEGASRSPAVADGVVYIGSSDSVLHSFDAATGEPGWAVQLEGGLGTTAVLDGVVYQSAWDDVNPPYDYAHVIDAATGEVIWQFTSPNSGGFQPPAFGEDLVYFAGHDSSVYALDRATGELVWSFATGGRLDTAGVLIGDILYVGSEDGNLYALDAQLALSCGATRSAVQSALARSSPAASPTWGPGSGPCTRSAARTCWALDPMPPPPW
jgi:outer membrane protein assembly factor BamB